MRVDSSPRSPSERATRIQALLAEVGTQMGIASRLVSAVIRMFYDFFTVACLAAAIVIVIWGRPGQALPWGGTGVGLALGWVAAKLTARAVTRWRRALSEEWSRTPPDLRD